MSGTSNLSVQFVINNNVSLRNQQSLREMNEGHKSQYAVLHLCFKNLIYLFLIQSGEAKHSNLISDVTPIQR